MRRLFSEKAKIAIVFKAGLLVTESGETSYLGPDLVNPHDAFKDREKFTKFELMRQKLIGNVSKLKEESLLFVSDKLPNDVKYIEISYPDIEFIDFKPTIK